MREIVLPTYFFFCSFPITNHIKAEIYCFIFELISIIFELISLLFFKKMFYEITCYIFLNRLTR
jgi:hypothetical protein